jgi:hypothetical protein
VRNFLSFGLAQLVGLWWTLLDQIPALHAIVINAEAIRAWGLFQWTVAVLGVAAVAALIGYQMFLLNQIGRLLYYMLGLVSTRACGGAL